MPLYEDRRNAENKIMVTPSCRNSVVIGTNESLALLIKAIKDKAATLNRGPVVALDGWYGIDWKSILNKLAVADIDNCVGSMESINKVFKSPVEIMAYKKTYITEDSGFGFVNGDGHVVDIMDASAINALAEKLAAPRQKAFILYGCGAATPELSGVIDITVYFDKTRQPILWQMWDGKLEPFGMDEPDPQYFWKDYYYCDYYLLNRQKEYLIGNLDFWIEAISSDSLKILTRVAYDEVIRTLLKYPIKEIKIYQPGPWGAYRYRDLFNVPGLECNAWNELAGPELGMIVDLGEGKRFEMPMLNLMQYQKEFLGNKIAKEYPGLFPMDVWLDDGYFPEKTPMERTAMPIHNHPSTDYVKKHFNEPLGRYETYYICEAYEGACSMMGYKDDADLEEWERLCRKSDNLQEIPNWQEYISIWDSNIGDLYLIPPGTVHGHGGNQMVLEMDTCASVAATEYSFFLYDFARNSWDDNKKAMTGKPVKMHLDHGFDNEKWRRGEWVKEHLLARPKVVKWSKDFKFDRYSSLPEMPFEIERFHYYNHADGSTESKTVQILTLTIGKRAIIRSKAVPAIQNEIELFQSVIIPAQFGDFELISPDGCFSEVVQFRLKC
jgi:hypothetical protein